MIESPKIPNPEKLSTSQILCKVGEYIEKVGWTRGKLEEENTGAVCLLGAINSVLSGSPRQGGNHFQLRNDLLEEVRNRIRQKGRLPNDSLIDWNDSQKSMEPVVAILKEDC